MFKLRISNYELRTSNCKFRVLNSEFLICQVDMMEPGPVQLLAPVLPPTARARTR
jgi:hypothetical protein